jgi:hypothetical protein
MSCKLLKDKWSDVMISWNDEMSWWNSESRTIRKINLFEKRLINQMIWSFDLINRILSHYIIIVFFMHERFDFESHLLIWNDSYRRFFINMLTSRRVVLRSFNRDDFFHIYWFSRSSKDQSIRRLKTRFWWDQIEVTTKLDDSLIKRK